MTKEKVVLETEEVELFRVYKKNGSYAASDTRDVEDVFLGEVKK